MRKLMTALLVAVLLAGCKTKERVVTVETVRVDTLQEIRNVRDSIWLHDSILVREKGDTVIYEKWHTAYRDRWRTDTVYKSRTDSVPVPYPVVQEVKAPPTKMEKGLMGLGGLVLVGGGVILVLWVRRFFLSIVHK